MRPLLALLLLVFTSSGLLYAAEPSGAEIMQGARERHDHFPYTFERQSMILVDANGSRNVRRMRRFTRIEDDGQLNHLLVFDYPREIAGVALRLRRFPDGKVENDLYLPAYGAQLKESAAHSRGATFLGSDFTVRDLTPEVIEDYHYRREDDLVIDDIEHFVVEATPKGQAIALATGYGMRRLFIRKENLFPIRIDYYDRHERLFKRETRHDIRQVDGKMWRSNMILMENFRKQHRSLIKIDHRIFSIDYVPETHFEDAWVLENRHLPGADLTQPAATDETSNSASEQNNNEPGSEPVE